MADTKYKTRANYRTIKEWRPDEKPREKLLLKGAESLSDSELLAILIRHGTKGFSAVDVARELLSKHENITNLSKLHASELKKTRGLGEAKAVTIAAAFELGKRIEIPPFDPSNKISSPGDVAKYYIPRLRDKKKENTFVLLLNTSNVIFKEIFISEGLLNASLLHPREVFQQAIIESASSIMLLHNHPSGNKEPSEADLKITKQLAQAGDIIGINLIDHIIITPTDYFSFLEHHLMEK